MNLRELYPGHLEHLHLKNFKHVMDEWLASGTSKGNYFEKSTCAFNSR